MTRIHYTSNHPAALHGYAVQTDETDPRPELVAAAIARKIGGVSRSVQRLWAVNGDGWKCQVVRPIHGSPTSEVLANDVQFYIED